MFSFGSKKKTQDVPVEEVQKLTSQGLGDKDIIKKLKSKGYSYDAIEKSMLSAVKQGVDEPQTQQPMTFEDPFPSQAPQQQGQQQQSQEMFPEFQSQDVPELSNFNPDAVVEELVEGVVEEKLAQYSSKFDKIEGDMNSIRSELRALPKGAPQQGNREWDAKVAELNDKLDELDARVGGLEKAFKQYLPSLTRNIEALSKMIHEMKEKQGVKEELAQF